jgi:hypothetical protein
MYSTDPPDRVERKGFASPCCSDTLYVMSSKTKIEYVMAELVKEDGTKKYTPKLKLTVKETYADEKLEPVRRAVADNELTPMSGLVIEDGVYTVRYFFNGQQQEHKVRIQGGVMLAA